MDKTLGFNEVFKMKITKKIQKMKERMNKTIYWSLRLTLGVLGVIALFNIVPHLLDAIKLLVPLYKMTDKSPEFRLFLLCFLIWVNCDVINTIVNIVFKLDSLLENKLMKKKNAS